MSPIRDNVAYDFSLFEPKQVDENVETESESKKQPERARVAVKPAAVIKTVSAGLFVMISLTAMMLCNVQLTSLGDKVSDAQKKLNAANSEEIRLNMELESRTSLTNVENYAANTLGLQKIGQYQVYYVNMKNKDKIELTLRDDNIFNGVINRILEYF